MDRGITFPLHCQIKAILTWSHFLSPAFFCFWNTVSILLFMLLISIPWCCITVFNLCQLTRRVGGWTAWPWQPSACCVGWTVWHTFVKKMSLIVKRWTANKSPATWGGHTDQCLSLFQWCLQTCDHQISKRLSCMSHTHRHCLSITCQCWSMWKWVSCSEPHENKLAVTWCT